MQTESKFVMQIEEFCQYFNSISGTISQVFVGHKEIIKNILIAFFSGGHVLLESVPGLGKTFLVETLSNVLDLTNSRIQFTPDLMPADIIGTNTIVKSETGEITIQYEKGAIFSNLVLADEINRATPKTQSALLQAMQEKKITSFGKTYNLPEHFMIMATQNPIEMEGTYPLPEAQLDRFFFKLTMHYPTTEELIRIAFKTTDGRNLSVTKQLNHQKIMTMKQLIPQVCVAEHVMMYAATFISYTQPTNKETTDFVKQYVQYGSSPRGLQTLIFAAKVIAILDQRLHIAKEDIWEVLIPTLQHRIILNFEGEAQGISSIDIIDNIKNSLSKKFNAQ